jgi:hypothetical protein
MLEKKFSINILNLIYFHFSDESCVYFCYSIIQLLESVSSNVIFQCRNFEFEKFDNTVKPVYNKTLLESPPKWLLLRGSRVSDRGSLDQSSLDRKSLFSVDWKFHFHLIKFFETFPWLKLSIMRSIKRLKSCHLIESFINDLIKWKNPSVLFWHLFKSSNNSILGF